MTFGEKAAGAKPAGGVCNVCKGRRGDWQAGGTMPPPPGFKSGMKARRKARQRHWRQRLKRPRTRRRQPRRTPPPGLSISAASRNCARLHAAGHIDLA
jgi:hypothetical protein